MKKIGNNKGFTLVELLAVIVVLAIVMGIAAVAITNVLDSTRKNAFVASARSFIAGAKTLVNTDQTDVLLGGTGTYSPNCPTSGTATKPIYLSSIKTENATNESPYGQDYDTSASYVLVTATPDATTVGSCNYTYSIYLTDGLYAIGAVNSEVAEASLASTSVQPVSAEGD